MSVESNVSPKPKFWLANMLGQRGGTLAVIQCFTVATDQEHARRIIEEAIATDGMPAVLVNIYPLEFSPVILNISPLVTVRILLAAGYHFINPDRSRAHHQAESEAYMRMIGSLS